MQRTMAKCAAVTFFWALVSAGCGSSVTVHEVQTELHVNQTANLWSESNYRYVTTGLQAHGFAEVSTDQAKRLVGLVMNALVEMARLGPNQALVDVTLEEGTVTMNRQTFRVVTLRGDVVEFLR